MINFAVGKAFTRNKSSNFLVGGLPEAVQVFIDEGSLTAVTAVQRSIADTYQDDFAKYAKQKDLVLLQQIFQRRITV